MNILITVAGLALLLAGGEGLVRGSVALARRFGISPLVIGLTIVGFGTSAPELVISVHAALAGAPGIALGNVIGSNMANMMLVLGTVALIYPLTVHRDALRRDSVILVAATLVFVVVGLQRTATAWHGVPMIAGLLVYIVWTLWTDSRRGNGAAQMRRDEADTFGAGLPGRLWSMAMAIAVGLAALVAGSSLAVAGATAIAREAGISEEVIGLTLVAIGTSLPEFAASAVAARRRQADVCVGNVLGSNLFNLLGVMGAAAIAAPIPFSDAIVAFDLWALLAVTALLIVFMLTGRRINRVEGLVLVALYVAYIVFHLGGGLGVST